MLLPHPSFGSVIVVKKAVTVAALAVSLGGLGLGVSAVANADASAADSDAQSAPTPPGMSLTVSSDETVDADGTQGDYSNSTQGAIDSDGDQDAFLVASRNADDGMTTASR